MEAVIQDNYALIQDYTNAQDLERIRSADKITWQILDEICEFVKPGVTQNETIEYSYQVFEKYGSDRIWHKPYIRFGKNTILTCLDQCKDDVTLQEEDIAFVDIGVVIDGIEGDAARTLAFGHHPRHREIVDCTEELFKLAEQHWRADPSITGVQLYDYIESEAAKRGFESNLQKAGHLIGSFSHARDTKYVDGLNHYQESIDPYKWIVEVQIKDPELNIGGFYEQLLG